MVDVQRDPRCRNASARAAEPARHLRRPLRLPDRGDDRLDGRVWFLEVNVAPGLTETSTVPLAVTAAGMDLGALVSDLVRVAIDRPAD